MKLFPFRHFIVICVPHKVFIKFYLLCTINGRYNTVKENHAAEL